MEDTTLTSDFALRYYNRGQNLLVDDLAYRRFKTEVEEGDHAIILFPNPIWVKHWQLLETANFYGSFLLRFTLDAYHFSPRKLTSDEFLADGVRIDFNATGGITTLAIDVYGYEIKRRGIKTVNS